MININFETFYKTLQDVIDKPRPFAHIRFGDGEGIVMGYPDFTSNQKACKRWQKWLSHSHIDLDFFAKEIQRAVTVADIIGTPCLRHDKVNQDWRNVKLFMHKYNLFKKDTICCCMDCTIELQKKNLYKDLFKNVDEIYYISCRDVTDKLRKKFLINKVLGYHLPPQHHPNKGKVLTDMPHYPVHFDRIKTWLDKINVKNRIVLIGAGGLGKVYCMWVKERGGIALDIGSIFDGWDNLVTRSYLKNLKEFQL